jgi:hypothetical protein
MKILFVLVIVALSLIFVMPLEACETGEICTTIDGKPGIVKDAGGCKTFLSVSKKERNKHRCGFEGSISLVCCLDRIQMIKNACDRFGTRPVDIFTDKIMNGKESAIGEFPHFAQLGYQIENDFQFNCGGALISANFVLTAAHCCLNSLKLTVVRLGKVIQAFEYLAESSVKNSKWKCSLTEYFPDCLRHL